MIEKFKKISSRGLILFSAIFLVAVFIISGLISFFMQTAAEKNGKLVQSTLQVTDFHMESVKILGENCIISTDPDPQLIFEKTQMISSVKFYMESTIYPGEMVMYYTEKEGQGFSERKRVWAKPIQGEDNWYIIEMPLKEVLSIRIDPTMYRGNQMTFGDFIFNQHKSFGEYFTVSYSTVFAFLLYTGVISSVLKFIQEFLTKNFE